MTVRGREAEVQEKPYRVADDIVAARAEKVAAQTGLSPADATEKARGQLSPDWKRGV